MEPPARRRAVGDETVVGGVMNLPAWSFTPPLLQTSVWDDSGAGLDQWNWGKGQGCERENERTLRNFQTRWDEQLGVGERHQWPDTPQNKEGRTASTLASAVVGARRLPPAPILTSASVPAPSPAAVHAARSSTGLDTVAGREGAMALLKIDNVHDNNDASSPWKTASPPLTAMSCLVNTLDTNSAASLAHQPSRASCSTTQHIAPRRFDNGVGGTDGFSSLHPILTSTPTGPAVSEEAVCQSSTGIFYWNFVALANQHVDATAAAVASIATSVGLVSCYDAAGSSFSTSSASAGADRTAEDVAAARAAAWLAADGLDPYTGGYHVEMILGEGNFGSVARVQSALNQQLYAVKIAKTVDGVEGQRTEMEAMLRLGAHENILPVHAMDDRQDGLPIMYSLGEGDMKGIAMGEVTMALDNKLELMHGITVGAHYAHGRGVLHCDLKPENFIIKTGPDGRLRAMIGDWGMARDITGDRCKNGTISLIPPEAMKGAVLCASNQDAFGLGHSILLMLALVPYKHWNMFMNKLTFTPTERLMFEGLDATQANALTMDITLKHQTDGSSLGKVLRPYGRLDPELPTPHEVCSFLKLTMSPDPERRPSLPQISETLLKLVRMLRAPTAHHARSAKAAVSSSRLAASDRLLPLADPLQMPSSMPRPSTRLSSRFSFVPATASPPLPPFSPKECSAPPCVPHVKSEAFTTDDGAAAAKLRSSAMCEDQGHDVWCSSGTSHGTSAKPSTVDLETSFTQGPTAPTESGRGKRINEKVNWELFPSSPRDDWCCPFSSSLPPFETWDDDGGREGVPVRLQPVEAVVKQAHHYFPVSMAAPGAPEASVATNESVAIETDMSARLVRPIPMRPPPSLTAVLEACLLADEAEGYSAPQEHRTKSEKASASSAGGGDEREGSPELRSTYQRPLDYQLIDHRSMSHPQSEPFEGMCGIDTDRIESLNGIVGVTQCGGGTTSVSCGNGTSSDILVCPAPRSTNHDHSRGVRCDSMDAVVNENEEGVSATATIWSQKIHMEKGFVDESVRPRDGLVTSQGAFVHHQPTSLLHEKRRETTDVADAEAITSTTGRTRKLAVIPGSCRASSVEAVLLTQGALQPSLQVELPPCPPPSSHMEAESIIDHAAGKDSVVEVDDINARQGGEGITDSEAQQAVTTRAIVPYSAGAGIVGAIGRKRRGTSWWRPAVVQEGWYEDITWWHGVRKGVFETTRGGCSDLALIIVPPRTTAATAAAMPAKKRSSAWWRPAVAQNTWWKDTMWLRGVGGGVL